MVRIILIAALSISCLFSNNDARALSCAWPDAESAWPPSAFVFYGQVVEEETLTSHAEGNTRYTTRDAYKREPIEKTTSYRVRVGLNLKRPLPNEVTFQHSCLINNEPELFSSTSGCQREMTVGERDWFFVRKTHLPFETPGPCAFQPSTSRMLDFVEASDDPAINSFRTQISKIRPCQNDHEITACPVN